MTSPLRIAGLIGLILFATPAFAADTYTVDASHSAAIFRVTHLNVGAFYGRFNDISGTLTIDEASPAKSTVHIEIAAKSVDTANDKRDDHLRGPDFFNAKQFPKLSFKSKAVKKLDDKTVEVSGDLTLRGVTKPLTLKLARIGSGKDPWGGFRTGFEGEFTIKRSEFGMTYMPGGLGEEVKVIVAIEAIKK